MSNAMTRHTLSVLVEDQPGVLARISALFSRRGFNIDSLAVGPTEIPGISRMTIVVNVDELPLEQVTKQLNKLVNVLKIVELDQDAAVQRELLLVKVRADMENRSHVLETVQLFRAKVVDVATDTVTVEATGSRDKLEALLRVLEPFGIKELVQSGMVAVGPTEIPDVSRMTIVVSVTGLPLEQVTKQLNKLVNVLKIVELEPESSVHRELLLVKVKVDLDTRTHVLENVELFRAKVIDVAPDTLTIEATGSRDKLQALLAVLEPFGIKELVQSGVVAVGRGARSISDRSLRPAERSA